MKKIFKLIDFKIILFNNPVRFNIVRRPHLSARAPPNWKSLAGGVVGRRRRLARDRDRVKAGQGVFRVALRS